jgi:hypothetical protein
VLVMLGDALKMREHQRSDSDDDEQNLASA